MTHSNHFSPNFVQNINNNKKEYHNWKNELTVPFTETNDATQRTIRPNFETIKRQNQNLVSKRLNTQ